VFGLVFALLFSAFLFHPQGLLDGLIGSLQYWLAQQPVQRGAQPWGYYLVLLFSYDWPELMLGAVGAVAILRRPTLPGAFLIWAFVLSLAVYTWAGEKMPWLLLHPLLPLLLLAGIGLQVLWQHRGALIGRVGLVVAAIGTVYLVHTTTALAYSQPADPRELLVFTQTSVDVPHVRDQVMAIDRRVFDGTGKHLNIQIDSWNGAAWPWSWYLRDMGDPAFADMSLAGYRPSGEALVVTEANRKRVLPHLAGYIGYQFKLREWWVPNYSRATAGGWARWLLFREVWNPEGSFDEWLYVRSDLLARTASGL
jgi:uncharacterized protein (TIGR03663 family)